MEIVETGVLVMKNGKAWGQVYADGQSTTFGWMEPEKAPIHDPRFCKRPEAVTWEGSPYVRGLRDAKLVPVRRTTTITVEFLEE